jgi:hypothetical protein
MKGRLRCRLQYFGESRVHESRFVFCLLIVFLLRNWIEIITGGSVKDRAAVYIIRDAESKGQIAKGAVVLDTATTHVNKTDPCASLL